VIRHEAAGAYREETPGNSGTPKGHEPQSIGRSVGNPHVMFSPLEQVIESAANALVREPGHRTHLASDSIKVNISGLTPI